MLQYERIKIYITREFNFYEKIETLLAQFWVIIYITSEFNSYKKTNTFLAQFWVIIYLTSKFNFYEKKTNRNFIDSILGNNFHN